jgi:hypothetical protein
MSDHIYSTDDGNKVPCSLRHQLTFLFAAVDKTRLLQVNVATSVTTRATRRNITKDAILYFKIVLEGRYTIIYVHKMYIYIYIYCVYISTNTRVHYRLCDLVVTVRSYKFRSSGFDSRRYHIMWEILGVERGSLSLVRLTEEQLGRSISGSAVEERDSRPYGSVALTTQRPLPAKVVTSVTGRGDRRSVYFA